MFRIFDYIYYRLFKQYSKQKWNSNPCASACLFLCTIQFLIVYCICMFFRPIFVPEGSDPNRTVTFVAAIVVMVSLYVFDYSRYKNKATELERKYKDSKANKWFKLWMLFVLMWLLFLLPFLVSAIVKGLN